MPGATKNFDWAGKFSAAVARSGNNETSLEFATYFGCKHVQNEEISQDNHGKDSNARNPQFC